jgi:hypothetical protein
MASVKRRDAVVAVVLALVAAGVTAGSWGTTTRWNPDALFYEAQLREVRGADRAEALREVLDSPLADGVVGVDDPDWVAYNADFYRRRWLVPVLGAAVEPLFGTDSLQFVSLLGFTLIGPAVYLLVRQRFRWEVSALAGLAMVLLPSLRSWAAQPLTDSVGVALLTLGLLAAVLVLDRGLRWLPLWIGAVLALGFTRDSTIVLVVATAWVLLRERSARAGWLVGAGVLAALPAPALFGASLQRSLAQIVNGFQVPDDTSWGTILRGYPHALWRVATGDFHILTRVTPLSGLLVLVALTAIVVVRRRPDPYFELVRAATVGCVLMLALQPNRTWLRLELVFVPVLAVGVALAADTALAWVHRRRVVTRAAA